MRTTLTLDDDVAALLRRVQHKRKASLKEVVNSALREGLASLAKPPEPRTPFRTRTVVTGPRSIPNLDNVAEILALLEGESHK